MTVSNGTLVKPEPDALSTSPVLHLGPLHDPRRVLYGTEKELKDSHNCLLKAVMTVYER